MENETVRQEAVEATLERNPNAFRPKIFSSPGVRDMRVRLFVSYGCIYSLRGHTRINKYVTPLTLIGPWPAINR